MVRTAALAGASGVKFQTYQAKTIAAVDSPSYWDLREEPTTSQYELFKKHECYQFDFYEPIIALCSELELDFCTTCFDPDLLSQFVEYLPYIKISSSDLTNVLLIDAAIHMASLWLFHVARVLLPKFKT